MSKYSRLIGPGKVYYESNRFLYVLIMLEGIARFAPLTRRIMYPIALGQFRDFLTSHQVLR